MASKLYVGGLSYSTTSETLREYFAQCGTVESASVITDKFSGQSRGFGSVVANGRAVGKMPPVTRTTLPCLAVAVTCTVTPFPSEGDGPAHCQMV